MDLQTAIDSLSQEIKGEDWFFDISVKRDHVIVYVHWMNTEVLERIPATVAGRQIRIHFACSKTIRDYKVSVEAIRKIESSEEELPEIIPLYPGAVIDLITELDRLEKICGTHVLGDIFFEAHDGKNAVTNWSARYPEVRKDMDRLLDEYGFDVIYEEIEL